MVNLIVAYSKNFVIGKNGKIPWSLAEDMRHFRETTENHSVIMGRKTWDSIPDSFRPLPKRMNIVVTRQVKYQLFYDPKQPYWVNSLEDAIKLSDLEFAESFIIGGAEIYNQALEHNLVDKIIASEIEESYDGDAFFPDLKKLGWTGNVIKEFAKFKVVEYVK